MLKVNDKVKYSTEFLRSTGQYTGPDAPTSGGPFARGAVAGFDGRFISIAWADGNTTLVHGGNLQKIKGK